MFTLLERLVGRDLLWRFGRRLYHHARREGSLDLRHNGEAWLQRRVARHAAAQTRTLTIVDVGANYGQWSKSMIGELAAANAPRAAMILFEPVPAIRAKLTELMAAQRVANVRIEALALSDEPGTLTMVVNDLAAGTHHLGAVESGEIGETIVVEVATLDLYWGDKGPIDFVKIDAEGYDVKVAKGMRSLFARGAIDLVQFEYSSLFMRTRNYLRDMVELAHANGYLYASLHSCGVEVIDVWHPDMESNFASAKLLIHPRALTWLGAQRVHYTRRNTLRREFLPAPLR